MAQSTLQTYYLTEQDAGADVVEVARGRLGYDRRRYRVGFPYQQDCEPGEEIVAYISAHRSGPRCPIIRRARPL